jgi:hypothetical protein
MFKFIINISFIYIYNFYKVFYIAYDMINDIKKKKKIDSTFVCLRKRDRYIYIFIIRIETSLYIYIYIYLEVDRIVHA